MYALSQAWRSLSQHLTSTLATFFTALVSFSLLFLLGLVLWNLDRVVASLEGELEVAAFLKPEADAQALLAQIKTWPEVAQVNLQTKEEALATLQLDYPYLAQAREFIQNPLPDTLRLKLSDPQKVREVGRRLERLNGVDSVEYGGTLTEQLVRVLTGLRVAVNILIVLLLLDTLFSVMGTIRLSIENRRDELRVMQLVGATRRFIQGPFVAEGILLTLAASLLALILGALSYRFLAAALQNLLPFVPVLSQSDLIRASAAMVLLALLLGAMGAFIASRANLREADL
ncbi:cell division protein FtsX [Meiothermus granaticius]|uniref:Cell division protein FtsX n=1 Tax=Meiothermus granaticius NBRC 107808 TaxID=1227551 RepID=A0A399F6M0_9DEIN|nr:permease-like cell division protein FtsX [Meiothermus granaticius]MCL6526868.1 permease-like cell division protein FtsX [Thermaceae bacterium]RIH91868.1 Cell division protein FtsX [Meiothermus granaticius NBRC 107808]GEM87535.1 cell division protein FtsX [Meiothermus granaticius NBRC 107808]